MLRTNSSCGSGLTSELPSATDMGSNKKGWRYEVACVELWKSECGTICALTCTPACAHVGAPVRSPVHLRAHLFTHLRVFACAFLRSYLRPEYGRVSEQVSAQVNRWAYRCTSMCACGCACERAYGSTFTLSQFNTCHLISPSLFVWRHVCCAGQSASQARTTAWVGSEHN